METCPTVRIKSVVEGIPFFVINESDFDPDKHELLATGIQLHPEPLPHQTPGHGQLVVAAKPAVDVDRADAGVDRGVLVCNS